MFIGYRNTKYTLGNKNKNEKIRDELCSYQFYSSIFS